MVKQSQRESVAEAELDEASEACKPEMKGEVAVHLSPIGAAWTRPKKGKERGKRR